MGRIARIVVGALAVATVVAASAIAFGRVGFERRMAREVAQLFEARTESEPAVVTEADLADLPEPVQRWLRWSGIVGLAPPASVRLKQAGQFRLGEDRDWMPFEAEEYYTTEPPGFVWTAKFEMAPALWIGGRDAYVAGQGSIDMRLLGLIPVASSSGPELDQGALLRYLNETVWFPAAALSPFIAWEGVDAASARATMSYAGVTASATFFFDELGRPVDMIAERYRIVGDRFELATWSTPFRSHGQLAGIRMPLAGEGVWKLASGDFSYIQLHVTEVEYDRPAMF